MLKTTFIARASDGLILSETYDTDTTPQGKLTYTYLIKRFFVLIQLKDLRQKLVNY